MSALWQQLLDWYARTGHWLNLGDNLTIILGALALMLLYIAFKRRG